MTLDELQQELTTTLAGQRACQFASGDVIAKAQAQCRDRRSRRAVEAALAETGHCTRQYIQQLAAVALAYPLETRVPDVSWSLYRSCLQAAKRTGRYPHAILAEALEKGWHGREVNALGGRLRERAPKLCHACGAIQ